MTVKLKQILQACLLSSIVTCLSAIGPSAFSQSIEDSLHLRAYVADSTILVTIGGDILHKDDRDKRGGWVGYNIYKKVVKKAGGETEYSLVTDPHLSRIKSKKQLKELLGEDAEAIQVLSHAKDLDELWEKIRANSQDVLIVTAYSRIFRQAMGLLYVDSAVSKNIQYTYKVTRVDRDGKESAAITAKTVTFGKASTQLVPPSGIKAKASNGSVTITWDEAANSEDVHSYGVLRSETDAGKLVQIVTSTLSMLSESDTSGAIVQSASGHYLDRNVTNGKTYHYTVVSRDYAGNASSNGLLVSASPNNNKPPTAPQNIAATAESWGVKVTWDTDTSGSVAGYNILRSEDPDSAFAAINKDLAPPNRGEYRDKALIIGQQVYYRAVAIDEAGLESIPSARAGAVFLNKFPPLPPQNLSTESKEDGSIVISWSANPESDIQGYYVSRSIFQESEKSQISKLITIETADVSNSGTFSFVDSSPFISPESHYWYHIQALNYSGYTSNYSTPVYAKPKGEIIPDPPRPFNAGQHGKVVKISWTMPDDPSVIGALLFRSSVKKPYQWKALADSALQTGISYFVDSTISDMEAYAYHAKSVSFRGTFSKMSIPDEVYMYRDAPYPPPNLRVVSTASGLKLIWSATGNDGVQKILVYRRSDIDNTSTIAIDSPAGEITEYLDESVVSGVRYTYSIASIDRNGKEGPRSAETTFYFK